MRMILLLIGMMLNFLTYTATKQRCLCLYGKAQYLTNLIKVRGLFYLGNHFRALNLSAFEFAL